jgi:Fe-S-cluster containining protein
MPKVPVEFRILEEPVAAEAEPLPERARLDAMLPLLRVLDDQVAAIAVRRNGPAASCAKGCSACCRIQPVPVTPVEAYDLALLVAEMPEPRRSRVLSRFAECAGRLEAAGLARMYLEGRRAASEGEAEANARKYLDLGLVCPFLEDDSCSIYERRPFTCREYFVTSPKELCADPLANAVQTVPMILSGARAALMAAAGLAGTGGFVFPLVLALAYAGEHREELQRVYPGTEVFSRALKAFLTSNPRFGQ